MGVTSGRLSASRSWGPRQRGDHRDCARDANVEHSHDLPGGDGERFAGYGIMGLPFYPECIPISHRGVDCPGLSHLVGVTDGQFLAASALQAELLIVLDDLARQAPRRGLVDRLDELQLID
jgi:hypothetical protein